MMRIISATFRSNPPEIEENRTAIVSELDELISGHYEQFALSGPPVLNDAYIRYIQRNISFGVLTILVILIIFFALPDKKYVLIALSSVGVPLVFTLWMGHCAWIWFEYDFNAHPHHPYATVCVMPFTL